jgi:hypothetical protein
MNYDNALARARASYTSVAACQAELVRYESVKARLDQALHMLRIALEPRGRFGLSTADCAAVVPTLRAIIAELQIADEPRRAEVRLLALRVKVLREEGQAWDTIWSWVHETAAPLGYGAGDSQRLFADVA